jgi:hypothetical protein
MVLALEHNGAIVIGKTNTPGEWLPVALQVFAEALLQFSNQSTVLVHRASTNYLERPQLLLTAGSRFGSSRFHAEIKWISAFVVFIALFLL